MHMEHHPDLESFCRTDHYQQWLASWSPPRGAAVDLWRDSEHPFYHDHGPVQTLRQWGLTRVATRLPFYLLATLEIGDLACVDIGCGHNWFRRFYPSIRGVDPYCEQHRDEELTPAWWIPNWGRWPRAFSINALHFADQATFARDMRKVRGILCPGGRAVITLNRIRIEERTPGYSDVALRHTLEAVPGLTRMVWMDEPRAAEMDGNVWLWLEA